MEKIFSIDTYILSLLDLPAARSVGDGKEENPPRGPDHRDSYTEIAILKNELVRATEYYVSSAQRKAQTDYFIGMLLGVPSLAVVGVALGLALSHTNIPALELEPLLGSLIAGGTGAIVSVMSRMTFGALALNYEAGSKTLRLLGGFRPIIGSIFGVALYILLVGNLLPIAVPADASKQLYFYTGVAFIAGFSERWAQDMLVMTRQHMTPKTVETGNRPSTKDSTPAPGEPN